MVLCWFYTGFIIVLIMVLYKRCYQCFIMVLYCVYTGFSNGVDGGVYCDSIVVLYVLYWCLYWFGIGFTIVVYSGSIMVFAMDLHLLYSGCIMVVKWFYNGLIMVYNGL